MCVWENTLMSEIIPFSKDHFHLLLSGTWAHYQSGQCRFWRLRFPASPKQPELGRHVYARVYLSPVQHFLEGVFIWGPSSNVGWLLRFPAFSTFTHVPLILQAHQLYSWVSQVSPSVNAFRQRQLWVLGFRTQSPASPRVWSLIFPSLISSLECFSFSNISSRLSYFLWKSWR